MRTSLIAVAFAFSCFTAPAMAATDAECNEMFKKADTNGDGVLTDAETDRFFAAMRVGAVSMPADGRFTTDAFMQQCKADVFKAAINDAGAPLKGANSFTEGQARDRAVARGYTAVTGLRKDDDGIWRGTANLDGKSVSVAIDYKGNVVSDAAATR